MFKDIKAGYRVWSFIDGYGVVAEDVKTNRNGFKERYPIVVNFKKHTRRFTHTGKQNHMDKYPVLFWEEIKFDIPKILNNKGDKIIFTYGDEEVEYTSEELYKLKDGELIAVDFNGKGKVQYMKDDKLKAFVSTGLGADSTGFPIDVAKVIIPIKI